MVAIENIQHTESRFGGDGLHFSVIIPTFNRPQRLKACLASVSRLNYSFDHFEVIVVDDGSTKPIKNIIERCSSRLNIKYLRIKNSGPAEARNKGTEIANGFFYAFTDDDCRLASDWLDKLEKALKRSPASLVGGRILNRVNDNIPAMTSQIILDAAYTFQNRVFGCPQFFATNNLAVPAELFKDVGGFNAGLRTAEDRDFCDRCLQKGYRLVYDPEVVIYHYHPLTLRSFINQHFAYGRGAYHFHKLRRRRGSGSMSKYLLFHFSLPTLLKNRLAKLVLKRKAAVLALLIVWEFSNTAGLLYETFRNQEAMQF